MIVLAARLRSSTSFPAICSRCALEVYVVPAARRLVDEEDAVVVCTECVRPDERAVATIVERRRES